MSGYLFQLDRDPQYWIMVALSQDKDAYRTSVDDPEQDEWSRRMMEHLEAEPQWHDGGAFEV